MINLIVNGELFLKFWFEKVMKEFKFVKGYDNNFLDFLFVFGKRCGNNYDGYKNELYFIEFLEKNLFILNKLIVYRKLDMDEGYFVFCIDIFDIKVM